MRYLKIVRWLVLEKLEVVRLYKHIYIPMYISIRKLFKGFSHCYSGVISND